MINAVEFAKAIADESRQAIMKLCCCRELCVSEIVEQVGLTQPTVSHHLAILREAGLVNVERRGREIYYSLNQERITWCCGQLLLVFAPQEELTKTITLQLQGG